MDTCHYCGWRQGSHNHYCPTVNLGHGEMALWRRGWEVGCAGRASSNINPYFCLGYQQGLCALEEAENSCGWDAGL